MCKCLIGFSASVIYLVCSGGAFAGDIGGAVSVNLDSEQHQGYLLRTADPSPSSSTTTETEEWALSSTPITSSEMLELQKRLVIAGHDPGSPDGKFGKRTMTAITEYMRSKNQINPGDFGNLKNERTLVFVKDALVSLRTEQGELTSIHEPAIPFSSQLVTTVSTPASMQVGLVNANSVVGAGIQGDLIWIDLETSQAVSRAKIPSVGHPLDVIGSEGSDVALIRYENHTYIWRQQQEPIMLPAGEVAISANGQLAVVCKGETCDVYTTTDGSKVNTGTIYGSGNPVFNPADGSLITGNRHSYNAKQFNIWDPDSGKQLRYLSVDDNRSTAPYRLGYVKDQSNLVYLDTYGVLWVLNPETSETVHVLVPLDDSRNQEPAKLVVSTGGGRIAVTTRRGKFQIHTIADASLTQKSPTGRKSRLAKYESISGQSSTQFSTPVVRMRNIIDIQFSTDDKYCFVLFENGKAAVLDPLDSKTISKINAPVTLTSLAVAGQRVAEPGSRWLIAGSSAEKIYIWRH